MLGAADRLALGDWSPLLSANNGDLSYGQEARFLEYPKACVEFLLGTHFILEEPPRAGRQAGRALFLERQSLSIGGAQYRGMLWWARCLPAAGQLQLQGRRRSLLVQKRLQPRGNKKGRNMGARRASLCSPWIIRASYSPTAFGTPWTSSEPMPIGTPCTGSRPSLNAEALVQLAQPLGQGAWPGREIHVARGLPQPAAARGFPP